MTTNLNVSAKTGTKTGRGRPRAFDPDGALAVGQQLFHAAGYDAVGLSAITDALGIKPPSFYAAFGSKADFFERVLERYASTEIALGGVLRPGRAPLEALADLLDQAARNYAKDPQRRGCLVLEAARGNDESESAPMARRIAERRRAQVREFVAATHPAAADLVTDFVSTVMSGLSSGAREGMGEARLLNVSRAAATSLEALLR